MKVLLRANVAHLGQIGDVVNVKAGFARNYLVPQGLAIEPTSGNLKRVESEKAAYLAELAKKRAEVEARAKLVDGKEITIAALANPEGHLYGSVGPAQIVEALARENLNIEESNVVLAEPIRTLDKYQVPLKFAHEVTASISVWVVPARGSGEEAAPAGEAAEKGAAAQGEAEPQA
jgi:large subunit ribosomal protein L9